jgi:integrase
VRYRAGFQQSCREKLLSIRGVGGSGRGAVEPMTVQETEAFYDQAVRSFGEIAEKSVNEANNNSRKRVFEEFQAFLSRNAYGVTVETATAADVGAFIVGDWIPKHSAGCRTRLPSTGQAVPSVSAVNHVVNHLSKSYAFLGYGGRANPAKAEVVKAFRTGYEKALHEEGVKVQKAKVCTETKLDALLAYLGQEIEGSEPGLNRCVLLMDQAVVLYLWESLARGKECGELQLHQVELQEQVAYPGWSKTVRKEPSARIPLAAPNAEGRLTFLDASVRLLAELEAAGQPIGESGFLFRSLNRGRSAFVDAPITSDTLRKRLQKRLKEAGLFEGETVHSFRRSAVQHAAVNLT